jgi:phosphoesterase RecJ-like protein
VTDTGSFRFASVTPAVHRAAADLLERGDLSPDPIHDALYSTKRLSAIRFLARVLDTLTLAHGGQIAHLTITTRLMRELEVSSDEAEGFVNYALSVEGVKAAVLFLENSRGVKMSFRSRGDVYVNKWAQHFKGGGHRNASGAFVPGKLDTVRKRVIASAPQFLALDPSGLEAQSHGALSGESLALLQALKSNMTS